MRPRQVLGTSVAANPAHVAFDADQQCQFSERTNDPEGNEPFLAGDASALFLRGLQVGIRGKRYYICGRPPRALLTCKKRSVVAS